MASPAMRFGCAWRDIRICPAAVIVAIVMFTRSAILLTSETFPTPLIGSLEIGTSLRTDFSEGALVYSSVGPSRRKQIQTCGRKRKQPALPGPLLKAADDERKPSVGDAFRLVQYLRRRTATIRRGRVVRHAGKSIRSNSDDTGSNILQTQPHPVWSVRNIISGQ